MSEDTDGEWMSALAAAAAHGREESAGNGTTTDLNAFVRANAAASKPSLEAVAQQIDADGDARYSLEELQAWMQLQWRRRFARVRAAVNVDPLETIEGTMKEIDTDNSGTISYAEFSNYTSKGGKGREWVQPDKIFKLADENHDSSVSFNEFVLHLPERAEAVIRKLIERSIAAGFPLSRYYEGMGNALLVAVTEKRTKADIDFFAHALEVVL